jgi:hypothetical protein
MRTYALALILAAVSLEAVSAQQIGRYSEPGLVFNYPKEWKTKRTKEVDGFTVDTHDGKGNAVTIHHYEAGTDLAVLSSVTLKGLRANFEKDKGKLVKGSLKKVTRTLMGGKREGVGMSFEVGDLTYVTETYTFDAPSKKQAFAIVIEHCTLDGEAARKRLEMIVTSLREAEAYTVIAQAAFNGGQGGAKEAGWAGPWAPASPQASFQKKVVFEGDAALHLTNTGVTRHLSKPLQGQFIVEQHVRVPTGGGVIAYVRNGEEARRDGPIWRVADGKFYAFEGDGQGGGKWLDTPFKVEPDKWHKVVVKIDVAAQSWEFLVDDRKFEAPQPLMFRSKEEQLGTLRYMCENAPGIYVDGVRILRTADEKAK